MSLLFFSYSRHLVLLHHPCSCSSCAAGQWIWPGNLPDWKIWLMFIWPFLQCYFFSWIRVPCSSLWCCSKVFQQSKGNERWECSGESGSSGIWKLWVFGVQWLNIKPYFWTDTFCLPCLLNSYCIWYSINNDFWNYSKPILKEKHSYWISTTIYLPALLHPQWLKYQLCISKMKNRILHCFFLHFKMELWEFILSKWLKMVAGLLLRKKESDLDLRL